MRNKLLLAAAILAIFAASSLARRLLGGWSLATHSLAGVCRLGGLGFDGAGNCLPIIRLAYRIAIDVFFDGGTLANRDNRNLLGCCGGGFAGGRLFRQLGKALVCLFAIEPSEGHAVLVFGHHHGLNTEIELIGQTFELAHIYRIADEDRESTFLETDWDDLVLGCQCLRAGLDQVGACFCVERSVCRWQSGRKTEVLLQSVILDKLHLKQDGVERSAVDHLSLEHMLHATNPHEAVTHEQRTKARCRSHNQVWFARVFTT